MCELKQLPHIINVAISCRVSSEPIFFGGFLIQVGRCWLGVHNPEAINPKVLSDMLCEATASSSNCIIRLDVVLLPVQTLKVDDFEA
ncbi:hypothetical protein GCM10027402_25490 [Arthrobacter monumenti]